MASGCAEGERRASGLLEHAVHGGFDLKAFGAVVRHASGYRIETP
jgi:hypothetical protein